MERDRGYKKGEGVGMGRDKKKDKCGWDNEVVVRVWVIMRVIRRVYKVRVE